MLPSHATWPPWNSPYHFIQLDIEGLAFIQEFVHWFVFYQNGWNYFLPYFKLILIITIFKLY